jgi:hypothetical protein
MNLIKFNKIVSVVLLTSATVWAAHAADQAPTPTPSTRPYMLTFHVEAPSTVPNGAGVTCRAVITPKQSMLQQLVGESPAVQSSLGLGIIAASSTDCAVEVPAGAAAAQPGDGATMSYRIDAFTPAGPAFVRTQQGVPMAPLHSLAAGNMHMKVTL